MLNPYPPKPYLIKSRYSFNMSYVTTILKHEDHELHEISLFQNINTEVIWWSLWQKCSFQNNLFFLILVRYRYQIVQRSSFSQDLCFFQNEKQNLSHKLLMLTFQLTKHIQDLDWVQWSTKVKVVIKAGILDTTSSTSLAPIHVNACVVVGWLPVRCR